MDKVKLNKIAVELSSAPKGILAADESTNTIKKRLDSIFENQKGVILADEEAKQGMVFEPILASSGDLVFFSSYVPHRSSRNESVRPRRIAFLTFNPESQGKYHNQYYAEKRASFMAGTGGTISINDDFSGRIVN